MTGGLEGGEENGETSPAPAYADTLDCRLIKINVRGFSQNYHDVP